MIKSSSLVFHETFQPEIVYIAKILKLASEEYSGNKFDISNLTGIPTGERKGKVEPHIKYASFMGLIDYSVEKGVYNLSVTKLGEEVFVQDPYLHEDLSCWLCHYGISKRSGGAPQWSYFVHNVHSGFGERISQERLFKNASAWCDVSVANMSKNVFSVVKTSYTDGCFEKLNFATWNDNIEFLEHTEKLDLIFVYAYALLDSWERLYPDKQEITDIDLKNEIGFNKIFGLNEDECNYVIDSLAYEGILTVNRQLYPATLIRTSNVDSIIPQLYSRLL